MFLNELEIIGKLGFSERAFSLAGRTPRVDSLHRVPVPWVTYLRKSPNSVNKQIRCLLNQTTMKRIQEIPKHKRSLVVGVTGDIIGVHKELTSEISCPTDSCLAQLVEH